MQQQYRRFICPCAREDVQSFEDVFLKHASLSQPHKHIWCNSSSNSQYFPVISEHLGQHLILPVSPAPYNLTVYFKATLDSDV